MNLYQFAASTNTERVNIYWISKICGNSSNSFGSLRIKYLFRDIRDMEKSLTFTALHSERGGLYNGIYNCRKDYPIEDIAVVDNPRYSLFDVLKNKIKY